MVLRDFRLLSLTCLLALSSWAALEGAKPLMVGAQTPEAPPEVPLEQELDSLDDDLDSLDSTDPSDPNDLRPLTQNASILSVQGGQRLMDEASAAVSAQNYDLAVRRLQEARQVFNQLSNFYQELAASFSGIDNRIAEEQRNQAVETAQMRDQATYQLALVHRAQNKPELAVPLLVQIIRSQNPTRDLGQRAYQQLLELGFVDSPYPRGANEPTSTVPNR
ncbi:hypothetical protein C7B76_21160 [filamentous cyanobacterium CCP2]|nr:hypothetical protein C7B76_21160 [filamentous cyanobacterium CCP2]